MRIVLVSGAAHASHPKSMSLIQQAFQDLARLQPAHDWVVAPPMPGSAGFPFLLNRKARLAIRALRPDLLLLSSPDHLDVTGDLPFAILMADNVGKSIPISLRKKLASAKAVITWSGTIKKQLLSFNILPDDQVHLIPFITDTPEVSTEQRQQTRDELINGKDYFLYNGAVTRNGEWERVLQAFSQFKKWQQSGLQLVLSGDIEADFEQDFRQQLDAYKYKHDIILITDKNEQLRNKILASAFVFIAPCNSFDHMQAATDALRHGIPVITGKNTVSEDLLADAAVYVPLNDAAALSKQMIALYKDERWYNELVQKGTAISARLTWQQSLDALSAVLLAAAKG